MFAQLGLSSFFLLPTTYLLSDFLEFLLLEVCRLLRGLRISLLDSLGLSLLSIQLLLVFLLLHLKKIFILSLQTLVLLSDSLFLFLFPTGYLLHLFLQLLLKSELLVLPELIDDYLEIICSGTSF